MNVRLSSVSAALQTLNKKINNHETLHHSTTVTPSLPTTTVVNQVKTRCARSDNRLPSSVFTGVLPNGQQYTAFCDRETDGGDELSSNEDKMVL